MTDQDARLREVESRLREATRLMKEQADQIAKLAQQLKYGDPGNGSGGGGNSGLIRFRLPTGIAAATSLTAPGTASDAIRLARTGANYTTSGGTTETVKNFDPDAVTGTNIGAWCVRRDDGSYELVVSSCLGF